MTAGQTWRGRRVTTFGELEQPGDYFGITTEYTGDVPAIFFLKPHARDPETPPAGRSVQHVCAPPHTFAEHEDGTLTISPSIGEFLRGQEHTAENSDGWHGYLERGIWRQV